jgi:hypothetical protein
VGALAVLHIAELAKAQDFAATATSFAVNFLQKQREPATHSLILSIAQQRSSTSPRVVLSNEELFGRADPVSGRGPRVGACY